MPKNVSITLDGKTKIMSGVTKIQTCLEEGGNCLWISKDDVPLTTLSVTEDGTYYPPENYYGFSKVIADGVGTTQMGELIEKTVDKNGTYNIGDESGSPYGYSKFTVNVDLSEDSGGGGGESKTPVVGKDEDGNDEMVDTDDDGNIVMTALPTDIKVIIPPTKLEYNRYEPIDYRGISVYAYISKMVHWLGTTTVQLEEGSTLNPISIAGETVTASVGDGVLYAPDRTGQNDIQLVWDGTKWIKPENYSAEKAVWKSEDYPTGKIPFEELIFPMRVANYTSGNPSDTVIKECVYGKIEASKNCNINYANELTFKFKYRDFEYNYNCSLVTSYDFIIDYDINAYITFLPSDDNPAKFIPTVPQTNPLIQYPKPGHPGDGVVWPSSMHMYGEIIIAWHDAKRTTLDVFKEFYATRPYYIKENKKIPGSGYTVNVIVGYTNKRLKYGINTYRYLDIYTGVMHDKRINYALIFVAKNEDVTSYEDEFRWYAADNGCSYFGPSCDFNYRSTIDYGEIAYAMLYGEEKKDFPEGRSYPITIPVQWKRPGDGKILETTFTAWMKDEESDDGGQQPQPAPTPAPG